MNRNKSNAGHYHIQTALKKANWDDVKRESEKILRLRPKDSFALKALGTAYLQQARDDEAIATFHRALEVTPNDPEIFNNLGILYLYCADWEAAERHFLSSLSFAPKNPQTWKNFGAALLRSQRHQQAIEALVKAIENFPGNYDEALILLASALEECGMREKALTIYKSLWENGVRNGAVLSTLIFHKLGTSEWDGLSELINAFNAEIERSREWILNPFIALAIPGLNDHLLYLIAQAYVRSSIPRKLIANRQLIKKSNQPTKKIRLGYFSADFRSHPVGHIIPQIIELHDRARFEVIGYSVGPNETSDIRQRIRQAFDRFVDLGEMAGSDIPKRIRQDEVDILINLQGWTNDFSSVLFAEGVAPVQISWVGYAGTMGHRCLADYLISDQISTPPELQMYYAEKLAMLDGCYLPMDTAVGVPENVEKTSVGLDPDCFVFCSFNNRYKINPEVFKLWCDILSRCPKSVLWLSSGGMDSDARILNAAKANNIAEERIVFASRTKTLAEHRSRITAADLALDPFPYNSHSSGLDILWAGVPMLTLLGSTFAGRVGASLVTNAGIPEMVTRTPEEYTKLAVELYEDAAKLSLLRNTLESGRTSARLWDTERTTRGVEAIFEQVWSALD